MRLSELSTDRATDVLCELTPYVTNILSDDELLAEMRTAVDFGKSETVAERLVMISDKITKLGFILLKKRKRDLFGILGALNEKTVEQIEKQNIVATMKQIRDIAKDKELLDFFRSCTSMEGNE